MKREIEGVFELFKRIEKEMREATNDFKSDLKVLVSSVFSHEKQVESNQFKELHSFEIDGLNTRIDDIIDNIPSRFSLPPIYFTPAVTPFKRSIIKEVSLVFFGMLSIPGTKTGRFDKNGTYFTTTGGVGKTPEIFQRVLNYLRTDSFDSRGLNCAQKKLLITDFFYYSIKIPNELKRTAPSSSNESTKFIINPTNKDECSKLSYEVMKSPLTSFSWLPIMKPGDKKNKFIFFKETNGGTSLIEVLVRIQRLLV